MKKREFFEGLKSGIPIALGYLSVAFTFGILAVSEGLTVLEATAISMTNLTSAGQVAGVTVIAGGGSLIEMALSQLVINMRYALMSLSLSQKVDKDFSVKDRIFASFGITDEIFAMAAGRPKEISNFYMYGLILLPFISWSLGTFLGAFAGEILPDSIKSALGIAIYGMFIAVIVPPSKKSKSVLAVVLISAALSFILKYTPLFYKVSSGFAIIICTIAAASIGAVLMPVKDLQED